MEQDTAQDEQEQSMTSSLKDNWDEKRMLGWTFP